MGEIQEYIGAFIEKAIQTIQGLMGNATLWWIVPVVVVVVAILAIIGLITLIVKSWKVLLVLAILGGIGFAVYYFVWGPGKKGGDATTTVETIRVYFNILKALA